MEKQKENSEKIAPEMNSKQKHWNTQWCTTDNDDYATTTLAAIYHFYHLIAWWAK